LVIASLGKQSSATIAIRFVERINAHDLLGLISQMTEDHVFTDSLGGQSRRPAIETGWRQYFEMVADYWIRIDRAIAEGDTAILIGAAGGTYVFKGGKPKAANKWETPAVWLVRTEGQKVAKWRIYSDNEPVRSKMRNSIV
jgi:ketosteroid isomerase-like protein